MLVLRRVLATALDKLVDAFWGRHVVLQLHEIVLQVFQRPHSLDVRALEVRLRDVPSVSRKALTLIELPRAVICPCSIAFLILERTYFLILGLFILAWWLKSLLKLDLLVLLMLYRRQRRRCLDEILLLCILLNPQWLQIWRRRIHTLIVV